jgi:hypothetical protein
MAAPARRRAEPDEPPIDPYAVSRAFARERAKRRARSEHELELKRARVRFWALCGGLLFFAIVLSLTIVDQIQALFGL